MPEKESQIEKRVERPTEDGPAPSEPTEPKISKPADDEPVTEESMLEGQVESLGMQLDDIKDWVKVVIGKDNQDKSIEDKKKLAQDIDKDLRNVRTKLFNSR